MPRAAQARRPRPPTPPHPHRTARPASPSGPSLLPLRSGHRSTGGSRPGPRPPRRAEPSPARSRRGHSVQAPEGKERRGLRAARPLFLSPPAPPVPRSTHGAARQQHRHGGGGEGGRPLAPLLTDPAPVSSQGTNRSSAPPRLPLNALPLSYWSASYDARPRLVHLLRPRPNRKRFEQLPAIGPCRGAAAQVPPRRVRPTQGRKTGGFTLKSTSSRAAYREKHRLGKVWVVKSRLAPALLTKGTRPKGRVWWFWF